MMGVRKAGEDFFWNSEMNDKYKCTVQVENVGSTGRQAWFQMEASSLTTEGPQANASFLTIRAPADRIKMIILPSEECDHNT